MEIGNNSLESAEKLKHSGKPLPSQNYVYEGIKSR
jgi:hypothetical protein